MKLPLRIFLPFLPLALAGCEKPQEVSAEPKPPASVVASESFAREYEDWKARAVKEFPDLGKAGTPFNTRFLEAAKELADGKGEELKYPNWPYLLAVKVNASLVVAPKPGPQPAAKPPVSAPGPGIPEVGRFYTIPELKALGTLPGAAAVIGRVTKFDEIGLPPGVLLVVLDDTLRCELTIVENTAAENLSWQRSGSSISLVRQYVRGASVQLVSLSMGQVLRVEGVFAQRRGVPVLVGTARRD
jgi:hypothetical protein